jgi:glycolate oxidase FAD binding subunit
VGLLSAALEGTRPSEEWAGSVTRLREHLGGDGGSVVIEHCPPAVKRLVDVWGPIDPGPLALMRRLKAEFDPTGVLNPGRFVGGL